MKKEKNPVFEKIKAQYKILPIDAQVIIAILLGLDLLCFIGGLYDHSAGVPVLAVVGIGGPLYLIPYWIAIARHVQSRAVILLILLISIPLDLLLVGEAMWAIALVWAFTGRNSKKIFEENIMVAQTIQKNLMVPNQPPDQLSQLKTLGELKEKGVLTQEEFEKKKAEILE